MPAIALIAGLSVGVVIGVIGYYLYQQSAQRNRVDAAKGEADRIRSEADRRQKELLVEARDEASRLRREAESEIRDRRNELKGAERRASQKEEALDRKNQSAEQRQVNLQRRETEFEERQKELDSLNELRKVELEKISTLTAMEARDMLLAQVENEIRDDANKLLREIEQEVKEEADQRSRKILATTMQRLTSDVVSENTVSVVPLPSEDMKGRIIGREGRNIRALEQALGVDVVIDDTPDAVTLSSFDPIRREIGRIALTRLLSDGRIHPARIEEMAEKAKKDVDIAIKEAGEEAIVEASAPGLHPEIVRTLGRLKFRYSYGQNQLKHAIETANLAAMIAHELGANVEVARRGGLLHDLGKAIDHDVEGTHAQLGADLARRHNVHSDVVHCIEAHHEEVEPSTVEAIIVIVADALSGSRTGARRESLELYLKRLEALEAVANALPGVEKSFAIQAGREIRVIVKPEEIDDLGASRMAKEISRRIQESLDYPGQVKVTVIRERRSIEYAK
ncbi:MAG: ribonuclease Y [Dehalococcoidia bacterium]